MNILEKEIEEIFFDALINRPHILPERGFYHERQREYIRQPDLGEYGRPDIIGYTLNAKQNGVRLIDVCILEFKKEEINATALLQACRYGVGVSHYVKSTRLRNTHVTISLYLIGKTIETKGDFVFTLPFMPCVRAYTFSLDIEMGLRFTEQSGYKNNNPKFTLTDLGFSSVRAMVAKPEMIEQSELLPF